MLLLSHHRGVHAKSRVSKPAQQSGAHQGCTLVPLRHHHRGAGTEGARNHTGGQPGCRGGKPKLLPFLPESPDTHHLHGQGRCLWRWCRGGGKDPAKPAASGLSGRGGGRRGCLAPCQRHNEEHHGHEPRDDQFQHSLRVQPGARGVQFPPPRCSHPCCRACWHHRHAHTYKTGHWHAPPGLRPHEGHACLDREAEKPDGTRAAFRVLALRGKR